MMVFRQIASEIYSMFAGDVVMTIFTVAIVLGAAVLRYLTPIPVLRYRAMINEVTAPGLYTRPYFNRYSEDALDLCDVLSSFTPGARATLDEISRAMGLPGKPAGIDGSEVASYFLQGRIKEIADYCETDIVNTYRLWLRHELFRGRLPETEYRASEADLSEFIKARAESKPHLQDFVATHTSAS